MSQKTVEVFRAEYFESKLQKWVAIYEGGSLEAAEEAVGTPIIGNPKKRVAKYLKSGVRKIRYSFVEEV